MVLAPLSDLRLAAGYRLGQDRRVDNAVRQIAALAGEASAYEQALKAKENEARTLREINDSYETSLGTCQRDRDKAMRSLVRAKGWNKVLVLAAGVLAIITVTR